MPEAMPPIRSIRAMRPVGTIAPVLSSSRCINRSALPIAEHVPKRPRVEGQLAIGRGINRRTPTQQGLTAEQVTAEGRGPAEPVADNKTAQGRAANRRVELVLAF